MIIWAEKIYIGRGIKRKSKKSMSKITRGKLTIDTYCIALPINKKNVLDIYPANELMFPYYKSQNIKIVGLAKGKEEAISLVQEIIDEVYKKTGDFKVDKYFI